jgi:hypothetical protein
MRTKRWMYVYSPLIEVLFLLVEPSLKQNIKVCLMLHPAPDGGIGKMFAVAGLLVTYTGHS